MKPIFKPKILVKQLAILLELLNCLQVGNLFYNSDIKFSLNLLNTRRVFISIDPYIAAVFAFIQLSKTRP